MKKWCVGCILGASLFVGNAITYAETRQDYSSVQTDVSVTLSRPILSDNLPGMNGSHNQISMPKPNVSSGKPLPKTNEQSQLIYSILGGCLLGLVTYLLTNRKTKERDVTSSCIR